MICCYLSSMQYAVYLDCDDNYSFPLTKIPILSLNEIGSMTNNSLQVLSSFDQFSNMILQDAVERRFYTQQQSQSQQTNQPKTTYYCDVPLGVYVIRGDSMVLLGSIPPEGQPQNSPVPMQEVSLEELETMEQEDTNAAAAGDAEHAGPLTWDFDTDLIA